MWVPTHKPKDQMKSDAAASQHFGSKLPMLDPATAASSSCDVKAEIKEEKSEEEKKEEKSEEEEKPTGHDLAAAVGFGAAEVAALQQLAAGLADDEVWKPQVGMYKL